MKRSSLVIRIPAEDFQLSASSSYYVCLGCWSNLVSNSKLLSILRPGFSRESAWGSCDSTNCISADSTHIWVKEEELAGVPQDLVSTLERQASGELKVTTFQFILYIYLRLFRWPPSTPTTTQWLRSAQYQRPDSRWKKPSWVDVWSITQRLLRWQSRLNAMCGQCHLIAWN